MMPFEVLAQPYSFVTSSKVKFDINDKIWDETELSQEREYIVKKWINSDCGTLMFGHNDAYSALSEEDRSGLSREEWNDTLIDNDFAQSFVKGAEKIYSVDNWEINDFKLKFIKMTGNMNYYGINLDYYIFSSMSNGYLIFFQYMGSLSNDCLTKVTTVVKTTESSVPSLELKGGIEMDNGILIITNIILTAICYMAYPLIRLKMNKGGFNPKKSQTIALWNAIIVGGMFLVISSANGQRWTGAATFLYYYINKSVLTDKNKIDVKVEKKKKEKGDQEAEELDLEKKDTSNNTQSMKEKKKFKDLLLDINERKEPLIDTKNDISNHSNLDEIKKLKELLDMDAISKDEYEEKKKELLKK
jgi:hypothetical protein